MLYNFIFTLLFGFGCVWSVYINECLTAPCLNGGTCINELDGFHCHCPNGTTGNTCEMFECKNPLGMESGKIQDSAITATSTVSSVFSAEKARVRKEPRGGAWCPKSFISPDSYEYLQVDLGELHRITMVGVQGRFGNGQGTEFAKHFRLEYQNEDGEWLKCRNRNADEIFEGNENTYEEVVRELVPSVTGKKIRFIPYAEMHDYVCMRVEIYGCPAEQLEVGTKPALASAFSVTGTPVGGSRIKDSVVFSKVITNVGGDYIGDIGQFVCRIPGVYLFLVSIGRQQTSKLAHCHLMKNAKRIIQVSLAADDTENGLASQQGSNSVILELDKGDTVYLGGCSDAATFTDWCTFSGSLMFIGNEAQQPEL